MKRYIKPVSTLIKMDQQLLLAGTVSTDVGVRITGNGEDERSDIKEGLKSDDVRGGLDFAMKNFMPLDDSDDNMNW